jgi:hypothetical protein
MSASQGSTEKDLAKESKKADDKPTAESKAQDKPKAESKPATEGKGSDKPVAESKASAKSAAEGKEDKANEKPPTAAKKSEEGDAAEGKKGDSPELAAGAEKAPEPAAESKPDLGQAPASAADKESSADEKLAVAAAKADAEPAASSAKADTEPAPAPAKPAATPAPKPTSTSSPAPRPSSNGASGATRTIGINLSAAAKFTTLVAIEWKDDGAWVSEAIVDLEDDELIGYLSSGDYTGVYAPFGWPVAMVEAVASYTNSDQWQRASRREFRHRKTEGFVHDVLQAEADQELWPQSVSCDRLALQARRMAQLREQLFAETGKRFDRAGGDHIIEVYPPGASLLWGMGNHLGNGNSKLPEVDDKPGKEFIERAEAAAPWLQWRDGKRGVCLKNEHTIDALLAALVARAAELNLTIPPENGEADLAPREGWMHLPSKDSLSALATA